MIIYVVSYVQGMGFIAGLLLTYLPKEDCLWMTVRLMQSYDLAGIFQRGFPRLQLLNFQLNRLLSDRLPSLAHHLVSTIVTHCRSS